MTWPCVTRTPCTTPRAKPGHVVVGGDIAVGVLDHDATAIARRELRLMTTPLPAAMIGVPIGAGPIDAGVHFRVTQDRMVAHAEPGGHFSADDRLADQELASRAAVFVVIVDQVVVGRLKTIVFEQLIAHRDRGEQQLRMRLELVGVGDESDQRIAGLHRALEIDVVGEGAHHFVDDRPRQPLLQRGLVEALVEAHPAFVRSGTRALGDRGVAMQRDGNIVRRGRRSRSSPSAVRRNKPKFGAIGAGLSSVGVRELQDDLLPLGDRRLAVLEAESLKNRRRWRPCRRRCARKTSSKVSP